VPPGRRQTGIRERGSVLIEPFARCRTSLIDKLKGIPGITGVTTDQENAGPRLNVTVNREVASSFGILPATIDNTLDDAFGQRIVSTMYTALNQYHVVLEVDPRFQSSPDSLNNIYVSSSAGQEVAPAPDRRSASRLATRSSVA
jgi:multidrug efflux pump subunit AcrB